MNFMTLQRRYNLALDRTNYGADKKVVALDICRLTWLRTKRLRELTGFIEPKYSPFTPDNSKRDQQNNNEVREDVEKALGKL